MRRKATRACRELAYWIQTPSFGQGLSERNDPFYGTRMRGRTRC